MRMTTAAGMPAQLNGYWQRFTRQMKERLRRAKAHGYVGSSDYDDVIASVDKVGEVLRDVSRRAAVLRNETVLSQTTSENAPELDGGWVSRTKSRASRLSNPIFETTRELRDIYREMRVEKVISEKEYRTAVAVISALGRLHASAEARLSRIEDANT
jgi:hypothetical protein